MKNFSWTLILIEPLLFPLQSPCLKKEKSIFLLFLSSVCLQRRNNPLALGAHRLMKLTRGEDHPWEAAKSHPRGSVFSPIWHFVLHLLRHFLLHGFSESHLSWSSSYLSASWWPWQISLSECTFPTSFLSCVALAPAPFPSPRPSGQPSSPSAAAAAKSLQSCPTLRPHRRQPTRLPCPWESPGKNTGVGCHFLLQCRKVKSETGRSVLISSILSPTLHYLAY